ncbi:hypothetical protein EDD86DRAFT_190793 [Gorgonomyces haynaldii]|nr:hypothetical protein EDD86DRAFT_190793 [Gorgonomyces haynaldii]
MEAERLPDFFPLKLKKCALQADSFFACFEAESQVDQSKSLKACASYLEEYKKCMNTYLKQ